MTIPPPESSSGEYWLPSSDWIITLAACVGAMTAAVAANANRDAKINFFILKIKLA